MSNTAHDFGYALGQALVIPVPILVVVGVVVVVWQIKHERREKEAKRQRAQTEQLQAQANAQRWAMEQRAQAVARQQWEQQVAHQQAAEQARQAAIHEAALRAEDEARRQAKAERVRRLVTRFGPEATQRILAGELWRGATKEMVLEILGAPVDEDMKVTKKSTVHTMKYRPRPGDRYGLRVTVEDGVVVGWEEKW